MGNIAEFEYKQQGGTPREGQAQYTEEEKAEWNAKWARFGKLFANRPEGATRTFIGRVVSIGEPEEVENTYPGATGTKVIRKILVECTQPGLEGLRWITSSANNLFNDKTKLYKLYLIRFGQPPAPPAPGQRFTLDMDELLVPVEFTLKKGRARQDGKRGGFSTSLVAIEGYYPDEEEGEALPPTPTPATGAPQPARGRTPIAADAAGDEDLPF